jgi:hypothetical protein
MWVSARTAIIGWDSDRGKHRAGQVGNRPPRRPIAVAHRATSLAAFLRIPNDLSSPFVALGFSRAIRGDQQMAQQTRRNSLTIVGILIVIILVLLAIYLFRRVF